MAALGERRPVEPRLTGQRGYAPCRPARTSEGRVPDALCSALPRPGSSDSSALIAISRHLRARRPPTPRRLQAEGLERLISHRRVGAIDQAVEKLRQASALAPKEAYLWSDLAAALYVRAQQDDEPVDLLFALSAAGKAVDLAPALPEALFNRALILDRLYLRGEATTGWKRYLEVDSASPWAGEAQAHLRALQAPSIPELWKRQLPSLRAAAMRGDEKTLQALVAVSPQAAREYAVEEVLGQWGRDVLAGKGRAAAVELRVAAGIGRALVARGGDGTVAEAVAVIGRAAGRPEVITSLARGHEAYARGSTAFRKLEGARVPFEAARSALSPLGSPVGIWAEAGLAGVALYGARNEEAGSAFSSMLARVDSHQFPALAGRLSWGLGLARLRQGRPSEALASYRAALADFKGLEETENLGTLHAWVAEVLRLLGENQMAWKERLRALAVLSSSVGLHTLLWEAGAAAGEEVDPEVGLVLQNEGVRVADTLGNLQLLTEALLRRSRVKASIGSVEGALTDLRQAEVGLVGSPPGDVKDNLIGEIAFSRGEIERERNPKLAITFYHDAITSYEKKKRLLNLAVAYTSRARARLSAGLEVEAAADLDAAIQIFEQQRAAVSDLNLRLSYSEAVQALFDERILLEVRRGQPERALEVAERARAVPLERLEAPDTRAVNLALAAASAPGELLGRRLSDLPAHVAFVEYAWVRDRLLRWTVRRDGVVLDPDTRMPKDLEARIGELAAATQAGTEKSSGSSNALVQALLPRALRTLPSDVQIFFVPDKALHGLSFAALRNPETGRYLAEEHVAVGVVPSITFYLDAQKRRDGESFRAWNALLVGNPTFDRDVFGGLKNLPEAETEIAEVWKLYPKARVLRGTNATVANFLAELDGQEILEYAGHAVDNPRHPAYSYLVLAPAPGRSGALFAHQLSGRRLHKLRLVILNGCQTIGARNLRVRGLAGLARPFLDAGAQAVLGTLWEVDDAAARKILYEFHRRFRITGDATAALREVQLASLKSLDPALRSPATWGAFQLVGTLPRSRR